MFPRKYLTSQEILALKPKAKPYKIGVGNSLHIFVHPTGGKYWRVKYRFGGKEQTLSIGPCSKISSDQAHRITTEAKELLKQDINPAGIRREQKYQLREEQRKKLEEEKKIKTFVKAFSLNISNDGSLMVTKDDATFVLTPEQTLSLKSFLNNTPEVING